MHLEKRRGEGIFGEAHDIASAREHLKKLMRENLHG